VHKEKKEKISKSIEKGKKRRRYIKTGDTKKEKTSDTITLKMEAAVFLENVKPFT